MTSSWWVPPWDAGVDARARRTVLATEPVFQVAYIRDQVLRAVNATYEDDWISRAIQQATAAAEEATERALMPQTWELVLSGFPTGRVILPRPPLIEVLDITYVDGDGETQTLAGSPAEFLVTPSGDYSKGEVAVLFGESWPTPRVQSGAVTITFRCGYEDPDHPVFLDIKAGMELFIAERYKQRSLSVQGTSVLPATLGLDRFWKKVYG